VSDDVARRRLALSDHLRLIREEHGVSGKRLAELIGWAPSKVSRIERNRQPITDSDIAAIGAALDLGSQVTEDLRNELRAIRLEEARWSKQLTVGHRPLQERVRKAEATRKTLSAFSALYVHGLAQTAGYARRVFEVLADTHETPRDTTAAVGARMDRQQVLYDEDKTFEILLAEAALRMPIAGPATMRGQIDRLMTLADLPNLRLGVIPLGTVMPVMIMHDFSIRDDEVLIELGHTEMITSNEHDVALYRSILDRLWPVAAEGDDTRALLARVAADLG
jgi:transcriptional regulator with XRE-family HTH domain